MLDINCDMGEGIGNEALLMPFITSANIACGYHAGDEATMAEVIKLCIKHQVHIGAHPSFADKENFGRTEMDLSLFQIHTIVTQQLQALNEIVKKYGAKLHHIKPHGSLYNMAAKNTGIAHAIAKAVKNFDASLIYYGLSGSVMLTMAKEEGLQIFNEVFADRTYQDDGSLTPRTQQNALITSVADAVKQVLLMAKSKKIISVTGKELSIAADTICIHGDGKYAVEFAKSIYHHLQK